MLIRTYDLAARPALRAAAAGLHNAIFPDDPLTTSGWHRRCLQIQQRGGQVWLLQPAESLAEAIAYARLVPLSGLPELADLYGGVAPTRRRQGWGRRLWEHLRTAAADWPLAAIEHRLDTPEGPARSFLTAQGFRPGHEELVLRRTLARPLPPLALATGLSLKTLDRAPAIALFRRLYDDSFRDRPWYQPFASEADVAAAVPDAADMLFLFQAETPVGVVCLHDEVIEPLAVRPAHQRRGFGRLLLLAALHELVRRGRGEASIGAWRTNEPALSLYRQLDFVLHERVVYLRYDLRSATG